MTYQAPVKDIQFCLKNMVGQQDLSSTDLFADATDDTIEAVLIEAGRIATEEMGSIDRLGDQQGAVLENGIVRLPKEFKQAYDAIVEGGWVGLNTPVENGGMGLPTLLMSAVNEMFSGGCLSLSLNPLMTQGQIEAIAAHGTKELQDLILPNLLSGAWNGTMNLTEPQAGSDLGALKSKAIPNNDGTYAVTGQKIFISWGDHDLNENISHLVLARLPDAPQGVKGISLFFVPKFLPNSDGTLGARNNLKPVSVENKLGLHASPTCVMAFDGATGWLIGKEHNGLAAMFTMMNNARLGVGIQGVGVAEAAYQRALNYALDRKQGRTAVKEGAIIEHPDVRRMLITMRIKTIIARAICYDCAWHLDMAKSAHTKELRIHHSTMGAFLTPIAKSYGTYAGMEVAEMGVQIHGGMGYIEDTGAAQYYRDVRVTAIYEGTNGIQAMDLIGRKMMDGGQAATYYLNEMSDTANNVSDNNIRDKLNTAISLAQETTNQIANFEMPDRMAGGAPYLKLMALVAGGHYLTRAAEHDPEYTALLSFFTTQMLPEINVLADAATAGFNQIAQISNSVMGIK